VKILAIDGGGALGCGPIEFMVQAEALGLAGADIYAGTSVGSLLVGLALTGHTWAESREIFARWVGQIFPTPSIWRKANPFLAKYPSQGLEAACLEVFGDKRCNQISTPFFIPVADIASGRPKVFDNTAPDLLRDVVLRSTAAPSYFVPRESKWIDGGLVANNPSVIAIAGTIRKLGASLSDIRCLSLATGSDYWEDPKVGMRTTLLGWASPLIRYGLCGGEERDEFIADAMLGDRHLRITPDVRENFEMDNLSRLETYRAIWRSAWDARRSDLIAWAGPERLA
jgi:patatin-like phospholipase/acyl hydrolase